MGDSLSGLSLESVGGTYSKYSNKVIDTTSDEGVASYMDFDSYLKLLVSQMSNQDFNDPMSDNEVLQQMASYSMLEGIKNMTAQANISYATSLVGKAVTVNNGSVYDTGMVVSVVVENNTPYVVVNGEKYEADTISDISSADVYNTLSSLIGATVEAKTVGADGAETTVTGEVTNVILLNGMGYVVIGDKGQFSLSDITVKDAGSEEDTGSTEGSGTENDGTVTETASVENTAVKSGYALQSSAVFDELMSTIDSISGKKTEVPVETEIIPDISGYETVTIDYIDVPDYAAAVFADNDEVLSTLSIDGDNTLADYNTLSAAKNTTDISSTVNAGIGYTTSNGIYDIPLTLRNADSVAASARNGRISSILTNSQVKSILADDSYETRYSTRYGFEVKATDERPGISISDCVPHRKYAEYYPEEAALADALGTRMYDIRYIHNTAITSRIDTSNVIGHTISGRGVTEIGYSGVGSLGEVVTFEDGTQRVEILLDNGKSAWYSTSGRYTLDEICNANAAPGSLSDLTPFEAAIRNHAIKDITKNTSTVQSLKSYLTSVGVTTVES